MKAILLETADKIGSLNQIIHFNEGVKNGTTRTKNGTLSQRKRNWI